MYQGWNRRVEEEASSKLTEIERKSGVRSYLEIIGVAVLYPGANSSGKSDQIL